MKITYLIGNGFDINLGLKTRFRQFYDYYLEQNSSTGTIKKFKEELNKNIDKWADLELALGDYAKNFNNSSVDEFRNLIFDIQDNLADYINNQEGKLTLTDKDIQKISNDLFYPDRYLNARELSEISRFRDSYGKGDHNANIIIFNYTQSFEKLYSYEKPNKVIGNHTYANSTYNNTIKVVEHIHGTTENGMILGVNDDTQINNDELRKNMKIRRVLIKPLMNLDAGTLRDERCLEYVEQADIVCVFGMSLGDTDKLWWEKIVQSMVNGNKTLIIFSVKEKIPERRNFLYEEDKENIKNKLLSYVKLSPQQREFVFNKIFVCLNSKMFSISNSQSKNNVA